MTWTASAPSNIALIKYMGKAPGNQNIPLNASLSYTLPNLTTAVELIANPGADSDTWEPLSEKDGFIAPQLSIQAQTRFLKHLERIKLLFNCDETFVVRSANNFPHGTGLASSASSFAALTKAAVLACSACTNTPTPDISYQANLSRLGSGSSCRSFFEPWALWENEKVNAIKLPFERLIHQVILIDTHEKEVSSSEAHRRVSQLPDYPDRKVRAEARLHDLIQALKNDNWTEAYQITVDEFEDMHALFNQCTPSFSYITDKSREILETLHEYWQAAQDGPLITMDAGPNIHLLYRPTQQEMADNLKHELISRGAHVI